MNKKSNLLMIGIFALALCLPLTLGPGRTLLDHPTLAGAAENPAAAPVNPVGTNIIVDVAKAQNPAVVSVQSIKKIAMRGPSPFNGPNPFSGMFPQMPTPPEQGGGMGSGFIIDPEGYVLTNHHVVDDADVVKIHILDSASGDEREYSAKVIGSDAKTDIALVKIERESGDSRPFPYVRMGNSDNLQVGEWVVAIGNPFGLSHTVTTGIVSAKGRNIGSGPYDEFIQTDASINPGNSGGPLLNLKGQVVGINTAIISGNTGGNVGIGFAIPINMAATIVDDLKSKGKVTRGYLGVMIQKLTPELAGSFGVKTTEGALVSEVFAGGPAHRAGLKRGDVVVKFGASAVDSFSDLPKLVARAKPGDAVAMEILRDGEKQTVTITIDEMKDSHA